MTYNGRHPTLYNSLSEQDIQELRTLDSIIHRRDLAPFSAGSPGANGGGADGGGADGGAADDAAAPTQVVLADDSSSDDEGDEDGENAAMLEDAGLVFKRPLILQGGLKDEFQGRQTVSRLFDLMDENRRIDKEAANKPPPE
jgi:hypothetical protein